MSQRPAIAAINPDLHIPRYVTQPHYRGNWKANSQYLESNIVHTMRADVSLQYMALNVFVKK